MNVYAALREKICAGAGIVPPYAAVVALRLVERTVREDFEFGQARVLQRIGIAVNRKPELIPGRPGDLVVDHDPVSLYACVHGERVYLQASSGNVEARIGVIEAYSGDPVEVQANYR